MNKSEQDKINKDLKNYRKEIDLLDREIVRLIGKRFKIVRKLAIIKGKKGISVFIPSRIKDVLEKVSDWAEKYGVDRNFICGIYKSMIMHSCLLENEIVQREKRGQ